MSPSPGEAIALQIEAECYSLEALLAELLEPVPAPDARATCSNFGDLEES